MFSLFAGRLKLRFDLISRQWIADVIVGPKKEHSESLELGTQDLQVAKDSASPFTSSSKQCTPPAPLPVGIVSNTNHGKGFVT